MLLDTQVQERQRQREGRWGETYRDRDRDRDGDREGRRRDRDGDRESGKEKSPCLNLFLICPGFAPSLSHVCTSAPHFSTPWILLQNRS